ncbi:glycosyltransferase family 29 protein [Idiomarina sp. Sol25]|uniref:glycosyltransferase family 29 protein n=1 Tax=Idiomarina sp. Sol25 TaxID=3064000 RepID=UPI00294AC315|nr:glycosyltransferase family 29 protein [Idiomarina sp. Sol25]
MLPTLLSIMNSFNVKSVSQAQQASQSGQYNSRVLHSFCYHWQQQQSFERWLDYMIFKRQLGYPLSPAHLQLAQQWRSQNWLQRFKHKLYGHKARQLKNLIDEVKGNPAHPAVKKPFQQKVAAWRQHEAQHLQQLQQRLSNANVLVVGNSPNLAGQAQGAQIDTNDIVVRFNQYASEHTKKEDTGTKLDVWVMAPGYQGPVPEQAEFVIVTGPNMLWWQQNWHTLQSHSGKVIGVPLDYWKHCVELLSAPPSAGFLVVQFLKQLPTKQLSITGFGVQEGSPYHHAIKGHQAVSRHNWSAESKIMTEWMRQHRL